MVRRLIVAAALAVASIGANAEYICWNFKDQDGSYVGYYGSHSLYVFVSGVTAGDMKDSGTGSSGIYQERVNAMTYTVQSKDEALSKFSSILASQSTTADLGNLTYGGNYPSWQTELPSPYTAIGAASFTAFAVVFDAADIKDAQNYMLLEDYSVRQGKSPSITTTYASAETPIESAANGVTWKTIVWGDKANESNTAGASTTWRSIATIPEPTSGVMLLLGVAALALKRKRG